GENREFTGERSLILGGVLYHPWRLRVRGEIVIRSRLVGKDVYTVAAEPFQRAGNEGHRGVQQEEQGVGENERVLVSREVIHSAYLLTGYCIPSGVAAMPGH